MATSRPQLVLNETTKVRVLDVRGFFGNEIGTKGQQKTSKELTNPGLSIMREILQIQSAMRMKFR